MFRRINFYLVCFGIGLSALVIIAGIRYINDTHLLTNLRSGKYMSFKKTGDVENSSTEPTLENLRDDVYIDKLMAKARAEIKLELSSYNFSYSGVNDLKELVMETGGRPLRSLIVSTWRSGSTFLGQILNALQGDFYIFEPFQKEGKIQIRGPPLSNKILKEIKNMFKCNFFELEGYFEHGKVNLNQFPHNTRLWQYCKYKNHLCYDADFTSKFCKLFPFQSIKATSVRLRLVKELLDDKELNLKVILLLRDPRAVMKSRIERPYPQLDSSLPELLCADMASDYVAASKILAQYPDRLMIIRYEDLALKPYVVTHRLYEFLERQATESVDEYLRLHTGFEMVGPSYTYRVSRNVPFKWKHVLDFKYVNELQMLCKGAMELWGYMPAHNATHMKSEQFNPVGRVSAPLDFYYYDRINDN